MKTCDKISSTDPSSKQLYRTKVTQLSITQNKNKQTKTYLHWWMMTPDQFCRGTREKMTVLKSLKQSLWSSTDDLHHLSHYI